MEKDMNTISLKSKLYLAGIFTLFLIGGNAEAIEVTDSAVEVTQENRINMIVGSSCRNFIFQPSPTEEKALVELMTNAQKQSAKRISLPMCKATPHAGIGLYCGTYWSQVVCESVVLE
jgi:hypothetical protein